MWGRLSSLRLRGGLRNLPGFPGPGAATWHENPFHATAPPVTTDRPCPRPGLPGAGVAPGRAERLTLLFSPPPRNFRIMYSMTTKKNQSHLLASQPWACSGELCLMRKCPPHGTLPGGSLTGSLGEENMKASPQDRHRGTNRNHLSTRMVSRDAGGRCSWWVCLPSSLETECPGLSRG